MGPALETFLQMLVILVIALGAVAFFTRPLWARMVRYLKAWYERDQRAEAEQKWEIECRKKAEQELRQFCHEDEKDRTKRESFIQVNAAGKDNQDAS